MPPTGLDRILVFTDPVPGTIEWVAVGGYFWWQARAQSKVEALARDRASLTVVKFAVKNCE